MSEPIEPGKKYNDLTVIERVTIMSCGKEVKRWRCVCKCGNIRFCRGERLKDGSESSCGCESNKRNKHRNRGGDPQQVSFTSLYNRMRISSKHRAIEWVLSKEDVFILMKGNCKYCGIEPSQKYNTYITSEGKARNGIMAWMEQAWVLYNGIDRKDAMLGYTLDNVVSCCKTCNYAKLSLTDIEFLLWIKKLYEFNFKNDI